MKSWAQTKRDVLARFDGHCGYCGVKSEKLQIDHIQPQCRAWVLEKKGKSVHDEDNLMAACARCNNFKTSMTLETFRKEIAQQVNRAREYSVNFRTAERFGQLTINESPIVFHFEKVMNASSSLRQVQEYCEHNGEQLLAQGDESL